MGVVRRYGEMCNGRVFFQYFLYFGFYCTTGSTPSSPKLNERNASFSLLNEPWDLFCFYCILEFYRSRIWLGCPQLFIHSLHDSVISFVSKIISYYQHCIDGKCDWFFLFVLYFGFFRTFIDLYVSICGKRFFSGNGLFSFWLVFRSCEHHNPELSSFRL